MSVNAGIFNVYVYVFFPTVNRKELNKWYKGFLHDSPSGTLSKEVLQLLHNNTIIVIKLLMSDYTMVV